MYSGIVRALFTRLIEHKKRIEELSMIPSRICLIAIALLTSYTASATLVFSNVSVTNHSVTFTVDGDMKGYAAPLADNYVDQFSIAYRGDLWGGTTLGSPITANSWSSPVFNNGEFFLTGYTVPLSPLQLYSWSIYSRDLRDAYASNRQVTLSFGNTLNPSATNGEIQFLWGNGSDSSLHTVLGSTRISNVPPVPEPGIFALMSGAIALLLLFSARARASKTRSELQGTNP